MEEIQNEAARSWCVCVCVGSESEGEGKVEYKGSASAADRWDLKLCALVKTRWNSVFECINRALHLKDAITRFSENDVELDGRIHGEDKEGMSDAEIGRIGVEIVRPTHLHSLLFPYMLFFAEFCVFVVFAVLHIAGVWPYFHPRPFSML